MKLNVGSGPWLMPSYLNIDNGSDYEAEQIISMIPEESKGVPGMFLLMDGNDLSRFEDKQFDEVYSNQCVGLYVTNYDELVRVLKSEGIVKFGVWGQHVMEVVMGLTKNDVEITGVSLFNGCLEDGVDECTFMIIGIKRTEDYMQKHFNEIHGWN